MDTTEFEGYTFPKRIANQQWIATHLPEMEEAEYLAFLNLLNNRRWTDAEYNDRILTIRQPA